jgi:hypothetical protein
MGKVIYHGDRSVNIVVKFFYTSVSSRWTPLYLVCSINACTYAGDVTRGHAEYLRGSAAKLLDCQERSADTHIFIANRSDDS